MCATPTLPNCVTSCSQHSVLKDSGKDIQGKERPNRKKTESRALAEPKLLLVIGDITDWLREQMNSSAKGTSDWKHSLHLFELWLLPSSLYSAVGAFLSDGFPDCTWSSWGSTLLGVNNQQQIKRSHVQIRAVILHLSPAVQSKHAAQSYSSNREGEVVRLHRGR